jgi:hypothetical protein
MKINKRNNKAIKTEKAYKSYMFITINDDEKFKKEIFRSKNLVRKNGES